MGNPLAPHVQEHAQKLAAFAINVETCMKERGLRPATVARRFGRSPTAIYQYTSGRALPRPKLRPDLAAALGVPLSELESWLKGEVVPHRVPDADHTLDDTLAEVGGVLRHMPVERWPVVVEIVRQVGRL